MSRRVESRRMQRARRRRRRLIAKMIMVLVLFAVSLTVLVKLIFRLNRESELQDIVAKTGTYTEEPGRSTGQEAKALTEKEAPPLKDQEPPVIEGVTELTVSMGSTVSYKRGVTVTDNSGGAVDLTVDTSQVDLNTVGTYPITYIARDEAGNVTEVPSFIHVEEPVSATEMQVNEAADEILAEITTEDMTEYEKAEAIFFWVHDTISWSDHSPKDDWVQGAYQGLIEKKGDCYVYAMASKCLLTRAGIKNMDIAKIPTSTEHYWNLIDLGDGWYHFDATRRKDKTYFFYTSDDELMNYSRNHYDSHNYDPSQYPEIQ